MASSCISVYVWFARKGKPQHITVELPESYAVTQEGSPGLFLDLVRQGWVVILVRSRLDLFKCIGDGFPLGEKHSTCFGSLVTCILFPRIVTLSRKHETRENLQTTVPTPETFGSGNVQHSNNVEVNIPGLALRRRRLHQTSLSLKESNGTPKVLRHRASYVISGTAVCIIEVLGTIFIIYSLPVLSRTTACGNVTISTVMHGAVSRFHSGPK